MANKKTSIPLTDIEIDALRKLLAKEAEKEEQAAQPNDEARLAALASDPEFVALVDTWADIYQSHTLEIDCASSAELWVDNYDDVRYHVDYQPEENKELQAEIQKLKKKCLKFQQNAEKFGKKHNISGELVGFFAQDAALNKQ